MKLTERIENAKQSKVFALYYKSNPLGFRVKIFNLDTCVFEYYDFDKETISSNTQAVNFLKSIEGKYKLDKIELKDIGNGLFASDDEINKTITVQEFKDVNSATDVLRQVQLIYLEVEKHETDEGVIENIDTLSSADEDSVSDASDSEHIIDLDTSNMDVIISPYAFCLDNTDGLVTYSVKPWEIRSSSNKLQERVCMLLDNDKVCTFDTEWCVNGEPYAYCYTAKDTRYFISGLCSLLKKIKDSGLSVGFVFKISEIDNLSFKCDFCDITKDIMRDLYKSYVKFISNYLAKLGYISSDYILADIELDSIENEHTMDFVELPSNIVECCVKSLGR